jgi:hypothetical protein
LASRPFATNLSSASVRRTYSIPHNNSASPRVTYSSGATSPALNAKRY